MLRAGFPRLVAIVGLYLALAGCTEPKDTHSPAEPPKPVEATEPASSPAQVDSQRAQLEVIRAHREQLRAEALRMINATTEGLSPQLRSDGTTVVHLGNRFRRVSVATSDLDGKVHVGCGEDTLSVHEDHGLGSVQR